MSLEQKYKWTEEVDKADKTATLDKSDIAFLESEINLFIVDVRKQAPSKAASIFSMISTEDKGVRDAGLEKFQGGETIVHCAATKVFKDIWAEAHLLEIINKKGVVMPDDEKKAEELVGAGARIPQHEAGHSLQGRLFLERLRQYQKVGAGRV